MSTIKSINIRSTLLGECALFLNQEGMDCIVTQNGLVELISQLLYYKEEGKSLYPEIYIFDDLPTVKQMLPISQFHILGEGQKTKESMLKALKKCAPLSEDGWSIYILRKPTMFQYGVFRAGTTILSVSVSETLLDNDSDELKAILIHQVADKIIEVRGRLADTLIVSFGNQESRSESPTENQYAFIEKIIANVEETSKEPLRNFLRKLFLQVLQKGHGTLACVISSTKRKIPQKLSDGILLDTKINLDKTIRKLQAENNLSANSMLQGEFSLVSGMMQSDGITIFTDKGEVVAYNVFVKHPQKLTNSATSGGARSRTFITLSEMINKDILAAYIQSQDGKIEFK